RGGLLATPRHVRPSQDGGRCAAGGEEGAPAGRRGRAQGFVRAHQPRHPRPDGRGARGTGGGRSRIGAYPARADRPLRIPRRSRRPRGRDRLADHAVVGAGPPRRRTDALGRLGTDARPRNDGDAPSGAPFRYARSMTATPSSGPIVATVVVILAVREG